MFFQAKEIEMNQVVWKGLSELTKEMLRYRGEAEEAGIGGNYCTISLLHRELTKLHACGSSGGSESLRRPKFPT